MADALRWNPQVVAGLPQPRSELWRQRGRYAFSASPHGLGLDCHRTWEGLVLGQIVLVPTSSIDPLFEGLRVVPLSTWDAITEQNLERWRAELAELPHPAPQLTSEHWVARMRRGRAS